LDDAATRPLPRHRAAMTRRPRILPKAASFLCRAHELIYDYRIT